MSAGISSSTLANLVKQMRANGDNQVVLEVDGEPVTVELRPAPAAPVQKVVAAAPACAGQKFIASMMRVATAAMSQNVRLNQHGHHPHNPAS